MIDIDIELATRRRHRDELLRLLGPIPPWWRPFKRSRWRSDRDQIMAIDVTHIGLLMRDVYRDSYSDAVARQPHPSFAMFEKDKP